MAKRGPKGPSIEINWTEFEKLCMLHCTLTEISEWFSCSEDTIERHVKKQYKLNFAEVLRRKSARGKISLRRHMWKKAEEGSITMQIWLSKQMLGHTDKPSEAAPPPSPNDQTLSNSLESANKRVAELTGKIQLLDDE